MPVKAWQPAGTRVTARCPVCGRNGVRRAGIGKRLRVVPADALVRCSRCGFGWVDRMRRSDSPTSYGEDYFRAYQSGGMCGGVEDLPPHLRERLERLAVLNGGPGRLLEVGCGFGTFLAAARDDGWQVEGLDVSSWAAEQIRERWGLSIQVGDLLDPAVALREADVVHLNHTLEHIGDPVRALERVRDVLRPGGIALVEVPNEIECLLDRARWSMLGQLPSMTTTENMHEFFFNARALRETTARAGLVLDSLCSVRRNEDFESRFLLGGWIKQLTYCLERRLLAGPNLVATVCRPPASAVARQARW